MIHLLDEFENDVYEIVESAKEDIIFNVEAVIQELNAQEMMLSFNANYTIDQMSLLLIALKCTNDSSCPESNWEEDIEPTPSQLDALSCFRVKHLARTDRGGVRYQPEKKQTIKQVDMHAKLSNEMQFYKQESQNQYVKSQVIPNERCSIINASSIKPWDIKISNYSSSERVLSEQLKEKEDKQNSIGNRSYIRKVIAKESIKRFIQEEENSERERKVGSLAEVSEIFGKNECSSTEQEDEVLSGVKKVQYTDFFATQINEMKHQKLNQVYLEVINVNSMKEMKPFDLTKRFPPAVNLHLADIPKAVIQTKFELRGIENQLSPFSKEILKKKTQLASSRTGSPPIFLKSIQSHNLNSSSSAFPRSPISKTIRQSSNYKGMSAKVGQVETEQEKQTINQQKSSQSNSNQIDSSSRGFRSISPGSNIRIKQKLILNGGKTDRIIPLTKLPL